MDKSQELREVLLRYLDADLERIIFSNPTTRESYLKLTVRPLLLRGALAFQTEEFTEKQAFQKNQNAEKTTEYLLGELENRYRNAEIASLHGIVNILISKKGTVTITWRDNRHSAHCSPRDELCVGVLYEKFPKRPMVIKDTGALRSTGRYTLESRCRRRVMQM